jgi:hypothetical protein
MVAGPTFSRAIQRGRSIESGYRRDGWRRQICCRTVRRARRDTHMRNVRVLLGCFSPVRTCRRGRRFTTAQRRTRLVAGDAYKAPSMTSAATRKTAPSVLGANPRRSHERRFAHTVTAKYGANIGMSNEAIRQRQADPPPAPLVMAFRDAEGARGVSRHLRAASGEPH